MKKNEENEGYNERKKLKENNEWTRYKKTRESWFFYGKNCLHGSVREKNLSLFKRYYEGKGEMEKDNGKWKLRRKLEKENKGKKESEGKEEKKYNANK